LHIDRGDFPKPAGEIEGAVIHQLRSIFRSPEMVAQTYRATRELEAEELERLRWERPELEARPAELRQTASRLLDSGSSDRETTDEIRRTNEEFVDTQRRFGDVDYEIQGIQARLVSEKEVVLPLGLPTTNRTDSSDLGRRAKRPRAGSRRASPSSQL